MKIKLTCKNCKKEFETTYKFRDKKYCNRSCYFEYARKHKVNGRKKDESVREKRKCKVCNKEFEVRKKEIKTMCSDECRLEWGKREDVKQKRLESIKNTVNEKYGVQHVWNIKEIHQKTMENRDFELMGKKVSKTLNDKTKNEWEDIKSKRRETKRKKYNNPTFNNPKKISETNTNKNQKEKDEINNKKVKTMLEHYGVESSLQLPHTKKRAQEVLSELRPKIREEQRIKREQKLIEKLSSYNLTLNEKYNTNKKSYEFKCGQCDNIFNSHSLGSGIIPICRVCNPKNNTKIEDFVIKIMEDNNIKYMLKDRGIIPPYELDIYMPNKKLGIELNGNYYHSELYGGKDRNYHLNKTKMCNNKNIKLIHVFEDEVYLKPKIVKSRLLNMLGLSENKIFARKCEIKKLTPKQSREFLEANHIQGNVNAGIKLGLFHSEELVSVMTFGKPRKALGQKSKEGEYEMLRFCNKINTNVVGGFSRLLSSFIKNNNPIKITTYADVRYSSYNEKNTVYYNNKFKYVKHTEPNYWYVPIGDFLKRNHRFTFRKDKLIKEGFDPNKTEWEIMQERGFDRIWDCGNIKYELVF